MMMIALLVMLYKDRRSTVGRRPLSEATFGSKTECRLSVKDYMLSYAFGTSFGSTNMLIIKNI